MHTFKKSFAKHHVCLNSAQIPAGAAHRSHVHARRRFRNLRAATTLCYRTVHMIRDPFISRFVSSLDDRGLLALGGLRGAYEWNIRNECVSPGLNGV